MVLADSETHNNFYNNALLLQETNTAIIETRKDSYQL